VEKLIRRRNARTAKPRGPVAVGCPLIARTTIERSGRVCDAREPHSASLPFWAATHLEDLIRRRRFLICAVLVVSGFFGSVAVSRAAPRDELTVDELKARVASARVQDRPHLCVQIAQKQLDATEKLYAGAEVDQAQAPLTDVVAFSELARDYSIQSHKYQKQTEIAVREMTRKLNGILHTLGHDEQAPIKDAVNRLERVRDDLLASMFKKGGK